MRPLAIMTALLLTLSGGSARAEAPPTQLWAQTWNSSANHEDMGRLLAADSPNRIYVAGTTYDPVMGGDLYDYLLLQYNSAGDLVWERTYGGTGGEAISDICVPAEGQVVITGFSSQNGGVEIATVEYDHLGNLIWDRRFPVQGFSTDSGPKLSADADHNIIVSGTTNGDFLILKYAPDGTLLWSRTHDGPNHGFDFATDIAVGPDGSIYATGPANDMGRFMIVKYGPTGVLEWEQILAGDIESVFAPSMVAVEPDGDIIVAGNPESTCGVFQFKIWKCSAETGAPLWSDKAPAQPCFSLMFRDMVIDWSGNILALCDGSDTGVDTHMQVLRYSPNGTRQWIRQFDGPGTGEDIAAAIATDGTGAAYVAGYTTFPPQNRDYAAAKFSANGTQEWAVTWASSQGTNDIGQDIVVDPAGDVIITGHSYSPITNEDFVTIKYHQASAATAPGDVDAATAPSTIGIAPNPMRRDTDIHYTLPRGSRARLEILSADGRLARPLAEGVVGAGSHQIRWDGTDARGARLPAGVYIVRLQTDDGESVAKVSILP